MKSTNRPTIKLTFLAFLSMASIAQSGGEGTTYDGYGFDVFGRDEQGVHKSRYPGYDPLKDKDDPFSIHNMVLGTPSLDLRTEIGPATAFEIRIEILRLRRLNVIQTNTNILREVAKTRSRRATLKDLPTIYGPPAFDAFGDDRHGRHKSNQANYDPLSDVGDKFAIFNCLISSLRITPSTVIGSFPANRVLEVAIQLAGASGNAPENAEILQALQVDSGNMVKN